MALRARPSLVSGWACPAPGRDAVLRAGDGVGRGGRGMESSIPGAVALLGVRLKPKHPATVAEFHLEFPFLSK